VEKNGTAFHRGKSLTLQQLGGTPTALPLERSNKPKPVNFTKDEIRYLSWNAGALTTAVWEELLSLLETDAYSDVKLVVVQETHWRGSWQFSKSCWHVVSSGTHNEQGAGVLIMVHRSLCKAKDVRFNEILPGTRTGEELLSLPSVSGGQLARRQPPFPSPRDRAFLGTSPAIYGEGDADGVPKEENRASPLQRGSVGISQAEAKSGSHSLYKVIRMTSSDVMDQLRSIKLGKAFDMVDRRRLREPLELAEADPFLIDLVGKLHIEALCDMTASDQAFSIATRRGIKQGCKLAPSLFAFATFLLFRRLGEQCDIATLKRILTMYADDTLLQMHFDDRQQLLDSLHLCDLLLDQLMELGFKVNPERSALLLQMHGGSAQQIRQSLLTPSGRLIALKNQVPYLGIIISYQDYEMKSLRHRLQASKAALKEVAHAVRNSRAITEKRRLSIWRITAWASAMYGLHVVGLTPQGLAQLESHMIFQLRFVLRSYSQETHENNQQFMQRRGFKTAKAQVLKRLSQFMKRQHKGDKVMSSVQQIITPRLQLHKVDAPGRHSEQCAGHAMGINKMQRSLLLGDAVSNGGTQEMVRTAVPFDSWSHRFELVWSIWGRSPPQGITAIAISCYSSLTATKNHVFIQVSLSRRCRNVTGGFLSWFANQQKVNRGVNRQGWIAPALAAVLLPVLAALYHETEVPAGSESLPGSYITQVQTLIETKMVKIKAQLFLLAAEILPADKLKRLHSYCETLRGYDEWQEIKLQRRHSLGQLAMMYYAMAKSREPTELGWSRLAGFLYDLEGASRETHILGHTQSLLPHDIRQQFEVNAEVTRQGFFKEDAVFNAAIAEWDLKLSELLGGGTPKSGGVTAEGGLVGALEGLTTFPRSSEGEAPSEQRSPADVYAGSLNRILEEPVSVYAQSDTVFRACLQLQKYLIEPIDRPITGDMHPAELIANQCLSAGEAKWADLLRIAQLLPQPRQSRFPQHTRAGELAPVTFTTGACARGPIVGITRHMKEYPRVTQVLAMIIQAIDPEHRFSSCTLSLNTGASAHRDSHNARGSSNLLVPCSIFEGGGIWLQNDRGSVRLEADGPLGSIMDAPAYAGSQNHHSRTQHVHSAENYFHSSRLGGMSQQDDSYRAEYAAYSARRAADGLPKVSYRNYLRQWRRSEEGHAARGEPPIEKGGKGGKGGVTPPPPPPKRRQEVAEGGDAPPAVKAKGGDTPLETARAQSVQQQVLESQERKASKVLEDPEFPDYVPSCGGTIADINQGRLTVAATKKLIEGLSPCQEPNTDIANALISSFLRTRKGLAGEDLSSKLGSAVAFPVVYDIRGSLKAGVRVLDGAGSLELPLQAARSAFEALGLGGRLSVHVTSVGSSGGETPLGTTKSGDTPSSSSEMVPHEPSLPSSGTARGSGALATVEETPPEIQEWLGEEGSLGSFRESAKNPESPLAFEISKGLAACLRHHHKPRIHVNEAGWARLSEVLFWPRIAETSASAGDILEVVRSNGKQRYQLGLQVDGPYYIRAVQGHSRTEVGEENLLEPVSEEQLPDTLLHGTSWNAYESIQQRGLLPGRSQTSGGKGGRKGGKWREGRQHVHFFSDAGGVSGQREGSTMLVRISTRKASEQGVRFLISRNGVYLTPDEVPPVCITSFQSLRTGDLYDRDGERIQSSG
ncbi:kptA, partial [Symbiodinium necroappetens]